MGHQCQLWLRKLTYQYALRDVVSPHSNQNFECSLIYFCYPRHASIDAATRAERGLPEDLIRLCVGIEDPDDLLDDLEHALLEAGAITLEQGVEGHHYVRASLKREGHTISRAVEKLALNEPESRHKDEREWFVSAPGKVILFGEHAVVHGVVSIISDDIVIYWLNP